MENIHSLCRLCGSVEGIKINIFEQGTHHVKKIHKILPITISEHDPLPKTMCHRCSYKVNDFFEFRTKCIKAHEMFKSKVPWLRNKQEEITSNNNQPPMVEVSLCSVNSISPREKILPNKPSLPIDVSDSIIIEDSPPYINVNEAISTSSLNIDDSLKRKKRKYRSMWNSKKRKRKPQNACKIINVFTTSMDEYQNIGNIENVPLQSTSTNQSDDKDTPTSLMTFPKEELKCLNKGILKCDNISEDLSLPNYILVTNIPQVGSVYTCEKCGRTFLSPQPASQHTCVEIVNADRAKDEEPQGTPQSNVSYTCNECSKEFTRRSQLITHQKKHTEIVSSSDDQIELVKKKKQKHFTKRKKKSELMKYKFNSNSVESSFARSRLLSSESE